jgi:hypothetical protein
MALKFKDVSSFSQDSTDRTPRSFVAYVGGLCLVVTRHRDYPGQWLLRCDPFLETAIDDCPVADAQRQAVTLLMDTLAAAIKLLG